MDGHHAFPGAFVVSDAGQLAYGIEQVGRSSPSVMTPMAIMPYFTMNYPGASVGSTEAEGEKRAGPSSQRE